MKNKRLIAIVVFALFSFGVLGILLHIQYNKPIQWGNGDNRTETVSEEESLPKGGSVTANADENAVIHTSDSMDETIGEVDSQNESKDMNKTGNTIEDQNSLESNQNMNNEDSSQEIEMLFGGDIYLSDYIIQKYDKDGIDGILSAELQKEFADASIAMINSEFAFTSRGTPMNGKQYTFRRDPKYVQIYKDMKLDMVTLANNHSIDFGTDGLLDTMDTLKEAGIQYVGAGKTITEARETRYISVNNKNIAILGASRVIPDPDWNAGNSKPGLLTTYDPTALIEEVKAAAEKSDYIVVYVHWGIEKDTKPQEYQRSIAKQLIDAGADLVIGSHPHVLQGIEYYKDKPIVYSLGNFMFYNSIEKTAVLKVSVDPSNQVSVQLLPCSAANACTSIIEDEKDRDDFYQYIKSISFQIDFDENGMVRKFHN